MSTVWAPPSNETELYFTRLPFIEAQAKLSERGPDGSLFRASATWHGTKLNVERGSCALVRRGGFMADYVGRRLRITRQGGSHARIVYVYVLGDTDRIKADISLTRRVFLAIDQPSATSIEVRVEPLLP